MDTRHGDSMEARFPRESGYQKVANGLGWFSIGLGMAEIVAPGTLAKLIGVRPEKDRRALMRSPLYGMREVAAGVGILTHRKPAGWLWGRVAGDVVDIGTLATALASRHNNRKRVAGALVAVLGVTALDCICAQKLSQEAADLPDADEEYARRTTKSIWVNKPPGDAFRFWSNFENLPRFMRHLESVEVLGGGRSKWRANGPLGKSLEWEAQSEQEEASGLISWNSLDGSKVHNSGTVTFMPGPAGRGCIVKVDLAYNPPGGDFGESLAKLLGKNAKQMLADDLRAFKQVIETGEVMQSDASIHALMYPAQPPRQRRQISTGEPVLQA